MNLDSTAPSAAIPIATPSTLPSSDPAPTETVEPRYRINGVAKQVLSLLYTTIQEKSEQPLPWNKKIVAIAIKSIPADIGAGIAYYVKKEMDTSEIQISYRHYNSETCQLYSDGKYNIGPGVSQKQIFLLFFAWTACMATVFLLLNKRYGSLIDLSIKTNTWDAHVKLFNEFSNKYKGRLNEAFTDQEDIKKLIKLYPELLKKPESKKED